jgi:hypothetical protein
MIPRRVVRELERELAREPGNLNVRLTLAAAYRELGRTVEAVEQYRIVASACLHDGRAEEALSACASGLELARADGELVRLQAQAHAQLQAQGRGRAGQRTIARSETGAHELETPLPPPMTV